MRLGVATRHSDAAHGLLLVLHVTRRRSIAYKAVSGDVEWIEH